MKRLLVLTTLILIVSVVLGACSAKETPASTAPPVAPTEASAPASAPTAAPPAAATPRRGGQLVVGSMTFPTGVDAMATTQRASWMPMTYGCEGLFFATIDLAVEDALVDTWTYDPDALTYTFKLRSGVNFHDGTVLTANDVVVSLTRFAASVNGSVFSKLMESIEATDDLTVVLKLTQPSAAVPAMLAAPNVPAFIVSAASIGETPPTEPLTSFACTGPYQLAEYEPDQYVLMQRFEQYTPRPDGPEWYPDEIKIVPTNVSNVLNAVATGAIDVVNEFPIAEYTLAASNPDVQLLIAPYAKQYLFVLNTKGGLTANPLIRQAVLAALSPEPILQSDVPEPELYDLNVSWFPPGSPWHSDAGMEYYNHQDIEKAKALLAEAGYQGEPFRILDYQTTNTPIVIEQQLTEAGFNVERILLDNATFVQRRTQPEEWEGFSSGGSSYTDPTVFTFINPAFPGWWDTPEKQEAIERLTVEPEYADRKAAWDDLQTLMWTQVPWVRHGSLAQLMLASKRVQDLQPTRITMLYLQNVWLSE